MNNHEYKTLAKEKLHNNFGTCLLSHVITACCKGLANFVPFAGLIISGPFDVGVQNVYMKSSENSKVSIKDLFHPFECNFGESFFLGFIKNLFLFLWSLLFIIPGIVKGYSYSMSNYLLNKDENLTAMEALKLSTSMMKGHKKELFFLDFSFIGWIFLTFITFGIAAFYTVPYMNAAHVEFFNNLYDSYEVA